MTDQSSFTDTETPPPCPLCGGEAQLGSCWVGERKLSEEPAVRCTVCSCRATLKDWQSRHVAQAEQEPDPYAIAETDVAWQAIGKEHAKYLEAQKSDPTNQRLGGIVGGLARAMQLAAIAAAPQPSGIAYAPGEPSRAEKILIQIDNGSFMDETIYEGIRAAQQYVATLALSSTDREYDPNVAPCDDAEFGMKP